MDNDEIRELKDDDKLSQHKIIIILGNREVNGQEQDGKCLMIPFKEGEFPGFFWNSHSMYTDRVLPKYEFGIPSESLNYPNPYQYPLTELGHIVIEEQSEIEKVKVDLRKMKAGEIKQKVMSGELKLDKQISIYMPRERISDEQKEALLKIKEKIEAEGYEILGLYYTPKHYVRWNIKDFEFFDMSTEPAVIDSYIKYLEDQEQRQKAIINAKKRAKTLEDAAESEPKASVLGDYPGVKTSDLQKAVRTLTVETREKSIGPQEQGEE